MWILQQFFPFSTIVICVEYKTSFIIFTWDSKGLKKVIKHTLPQWNFYIGQPLTKYQIFTCFSKFCVFLSNQTYG